MAERGTAGGLASSTSGVSAVVEGVPITAYGDSYTAASAATAGQGYAQVTWLERVARRLGSAGNLLEGPSAANRMRNFSVGGYCSTDCALYAYGAYTDSAGAFNGAATAPSVAGTFSNSTAPPGLVFLFAGGNDAGKDGGANTARFQTAFQNAMNSLLRLFRASSRIEDTDASFVYTGTWTAQTNATATSYFSGGEAKYTTTAGDHVTITTPAGTDFDLVTIGIDSAIGVTGAAFTITVDGVAYNPPYGPTTINDQTITGDSALGQGVLPVAIPLHGLSNQAHTIVLTHAGTTGQYLYVDCLLQQSPNPPIIVVPHLVHLPAAGFTKAWNSGSSNTTVDTYNALIDTLVGHFPNDGSVQTIDFNSLGWEPSYGPAGHISSLDPNGIHPNDAGTAFMADQIMDLLNTLPAQQGLVTV